MKCDRCGKDGACIHVVKVVKGKKLESWLCSECARKDQELNMFKVFNADDISVDDMINEIAGYINDINGISEIDEKTLVCSNCGTTYSECKKTGLVGCSKCYEAFKNQILSELERMQGCNIYSGKIPERQCKEIIVKRALSKLKHEMDKFIEVEEYEKAAEIRDQIKILQEKKN